MVADPDVRALRLAGASLLPSVSSPSTALWKLGWDASGSDDSRMTGQKKEHVARPRKN